MGKAGRAACIFTPMALTIASLVCVILINLGGMSKHSSTLNDLYFFEADFSNFSASSSSSDELSLVLTAAVNSGQIADFYQVHLWNYCKGNETDATSSKNRTQEVTWCSPRKTNFWFNPLEVWNIQQVINDTASSVAGEAGESVAQSLTSNMTAIEDKLLDKSARDALKTYKAVSKWLFFAYFAGLWFLLGTVIFGILAVFTRWFAFITSIVSIIATLLTFGASITATIMFPILVKALKETIDDYNIKFTTSTHMLRVTWLATALTLLATLFWLFSTCCCSGSSNPHHRSNRDAPAAGMGGQPRSQGMAAMAGGLGSSRGRSLRVDKTGGNYERVQSPYVGGHDHGDNVPLTAYGQQQQHANPYEPYRHG